MPPELSAEILSFIRELGAGGRAPARRDALLVRLFRAQSRGIDVVERMVRQAAPRMRSDPKAWPAVPTEAFRLARIAAHPKTEDTRVFRTSGTTSGARGARHFRDLTLYRTTCGISAETRLFEAEGRARILALVAAEERAPDSSLSFMVTRFAEAHGAGVTWAWGPEGLDVRAARAVLDEAERDRVPLVLLATSFALAFLLEQSAGERWTLAAGSRLMYTGGFKGRTREITPAALAQKLAETLGIPPEAQIGEYGMTELASQAWTTGEWHGGLPVYRFHGWVRPDVVDPENLQSLALGETGLLRIDDLANVDAPAAVLTSDCATMLSGERFVLQGRDAAAVPRGCSLRAEEAMR